MPKIFKLTIPHFDKEQWEFSYTAENINCAMIVKNILANILSLFPEVEDTHPPEPQNSTPNYEPNKSV